MDPLQSNEIIQQFIKVLETSGRPGQSADLALLMSYIEDMTRQLEAVSHELQEVKAQLAQAKPSPEKNALGTMVQTLEEKVQQARKNLGSLREKIAVGTVTATKEFIKIGVSAFDNVVAAIGVKNTLESLQEKISGMIADTKQSIEKVADIGHELRSAGGHLKNAGRAMTGKEMQTVNGGQEGRLQFAVLAPMYATQALLINMNNATLATIGTVERLERAAGRARASRKPSIRQALKENQAEIAAQTAPTPEKDRKPPETAL